MARTTPLQHPQVRPVRARRSPNWKRLWALRLATTDERLLLRTADAVDGMDANLRTDSLATMMAGKVKRRPFKGLFPLAAAPGSITHVDVFQISQIDLPRTALRARGRRAKPYKYGIVFVDAYSHRIMLFGLSGLTEQEIEQTFLWYTMQLGSASMTGCQWSLGPGALRHFQMDGGTSLVSRRIERLLARLGFGATVTSAPDTPQNNAVAESAVRYFRERLPATMTAGQIPSEDWYYAAISITAAHNKLANGRRSNTISFVALPAACFAWECTDARRTGRSRSDAVLVALTTGVGMGCKSMARGAGFWAGCAGSTTAGSFSPGR